MQSTDWSTVKMSEDLLRFVRTYEFDSYPWFKPDLFWTLHSASTKFQDWHYKKDLRERNNTSIICFLTYIPSNCTHRIARSYSFWMPL